MGGEKPAIRDDAAGVITIRLVRFLTPRAKTKFSRPDDADIVGQNCKPICENLKTLIPGVSQPTGCDRRCRDTGALTARVLR